MTLTQIHLRSLERQRKNPTPIIKEQEALKQKVRNKTKVDIKKMS